MPAVSICMVSLNCLNVVVDCLVSLRNGTFQDYEILCVDNGSVDGTLEYLRQQPDVRLVENGYNAGFTKSTNQGIHLGTGRYILWLNTDTILRSDSLEKLVTFLDEHPRTGIVGPKVLNADGSFQPQCKRGMPTPFASLCYTLGLDRVWPEKPEVSRYLLRSVSEDAASVVDAVSGCCLMARRDVFDQIGPLDEAMFGFGEDLDWCVRATNGGWDVSYYPGSVITHLKGMGGAHSKPYHKIWGTHQCMWLFYRKHLAPQYSPLMTAVVALGVGSSLAANTGAMWLRRSLRRITRTPARG